MMVMIFLLRTTEGHILLAYSAGKKFNPSLHVVSEKHANVLCKFGLPDVLDARQREQKDEW